MKGARVLGVIAARGGSKGIQKKNLALLRGHPLIYYTIRAAQRSKRLTKVILSSDDEEIIAVSEKLGVTAPFVRPSCLARDRSASVDVVVHATRFVEVQEHRAYDFVLLLQPTAPLRTEKDIDQAIALSENSDADSVVSVARVKEPHPVKMLTLQEGMLRPFLPDSWSERLARQELDPVFYPNGAVYCVRRDVLLSGNTLWGQKTLAYIMPIERSVNIDTWRDLILAEGILRELEEGCVR